MSQEIQQTPAEVQGLAIQNREVGEGALLTARSGKNSPTSPKAHQRLRILSLKG